MTAMTRLPVACTLSEPDLAKRRAGLFGRLFSRGSCRDGGRAPAQQTRGHMRSRFFASNSSLLMSPRA